MEANDIAQEVLKQYGIDVIKIPDSIYKYRAIDEYTDNLFIEGHLWFSKPEDFNDLFDCQLHIHSDNTDDEIRNFLMETRPSMPLHERNKFINNIRRNQNGWNLNNFFSKTLNESGICCFAGSPDNNLMWSHYANCHKGFCLKFDWKSDWNFFKLLFPAIYVNDYPNINYLKKPKSSLTKIIATKSKDWEYEQELRVFKYKIQGLIKFKKSALQEVIFGAKCSEDSIGHLKKIITANNYPNVKFKKVVKSNSEFKIEIEDL